MKIKNCNGCMIGMIVCAHFSLLWKRYAYLPAAIHLLHFFLLPLPKPFFLCCCCSPFLLTPFLLHGIKSPHGGNAKLHHPQMYSLLSLRLALCQPLFSPIFAYFRFFPVSLLLLIVQ